MAALYVEHIRRVQPTGPYLLGGHCFGGVIALEVAFQLEQAGEEVALLVASDSLPRAALPHEMSFLRRFRHHSRLVRELVPTVDAGSVLLRPARLTLSEMATGWRVRIDQRLRGSSADGLSGRLQSGRDALWRSLSVAYTVKGRQPPGRFDNVERSIKRGVRHYPRSPEVHCPVLLFRADRGEASLALAARRWRRQTVGTLAVVPVHGQGVSHFTMIRDPLVSQIATPLAAAILHGSLPGSVHEQRGTAHGEVTE